MNRRVFRILGAVLLGICCAYVFIYARFLRLAELKTYSSFFHFRTLHSCDTNRVLFARPVNWHQYFHCPIRYQPHTTGTSFLLLLFLYPRSFCCLSPIGRAEQASSIHLTLPCTGSISVGRVVRRFKGWPLPYSLASSRRATSSMRMASPCLAPATESDMRAPMSAM